MQSDELLFQRLPAHHGELGLITLNRPNALNALNHSMIQSLYQTLSQWRDDPQLLAVVIRATPGRAFCAGGDIRHIYELVQQQAANVADFFWDEYRLNHCIHHFPKPYIALMDGITLGGGVGISTHGSHRVGTEHYGFAMPETQIGFFPDVGATFFLPRLTGGLGHYLGLSGAKLNLEDSCYAGLIDHPIRQADLDDILQALCETDMQQNAHQAVSNTLHRFTQTLDHCALEDKQADIDAIFQQDSIESILQQLTLNSNEWAQSCLTQLHSKSPTSLKVTFSALQKGASLSFDACLQMEYRLVNQFLQAHDFMEGVRALIIDKDKQPNWQPKRMSDVSDRLVTDYFSAFNGQELQFESHLVEAN